MPKSLIFYIDKEHYPYHSNDLSLKNLDLLKDSAPSTWLSWTLMTYLHLKDYYTCELVDKMPTQGIIFFFRGSVSLNKKPNRKQLWVCMVADGHTHPYAHINIFQNAIQHKRHQGNSYFMRHWPQLNIIKSERQTDAFQNLYYFGNKDNLAEELKSDDWEKFIQKNNFNFVVPKASLWNDYREVDAVIAIRSFDKNASFDNKPASKLINSWLAETIFISVKESAYVHEINDEHDMVQVNSYYELKKKLIYIKNNSEDINKYKLASLNLQKRHKIERYISDWQLIINNIIKNHKVPNKLAHTFFILNKFILFKASTLLRRIKNKTRGK